MAAKVELFGEWRRLRPRKKRFGSATSVCISGSQNWPVFEEGKLCSADKIRYPDLHGCSARCQ
ncbi:hypothetical protein CASFOL_017083 [Castilleja foliolosa]|uniref:Uncharacterized protein n=1 Tax=Castilleja foliolosa TaxID=1961234 RepID=A0ABD3DE12_9LAMI